MVLKEENPHTPRKHNNFTGKKGGNFNYICQFFFWKIRAEKPNYTRKKPIMPCIKLKSRLPLSLSNLGKATLVELTYLLIFFFAFN